MDGRPFKLRDAGVPLEEKEGDEADVRHDESALVFSSTWSDEPSVKYPHQRVLFPDTVRVKRVVYAMFDLSDSKDVEELGEIERIHGNLGRFEIIGEIEKKFLDGVRPTWLALCHYRIFEFKVPEEETKWIQK